MHVSGSSELTYEQEVSIDAEQVKWEKEFGEDVANDMRKLVDEDLADYEYLRSKKLQV